MVHSALTRSIPTEQADKPVVEWLPSETAPRDGSWILIEGEMSGGDTSSVRVGRWNPTYFPETDGVYEWECIDATALAPEDRSIQPDEFVNWYCDGRVSGWLPLPTSLPDRIAGYGAARSEAECTQENEWRPAKEVLSEEAIARFRGKKDNPND